MTLRLSMAALEPGGEDTTSVVNRIALTWVVPQKSVLNDNIPSRYTFHKSLAKSISTLRSILLPKSKVPMVPPGVALTLPSELKLRSVEKYPERTT